jgi:hypothetical protein
MGDFVAESNLNYADLTQDVSEEKHFIMWCGDWFCGILLKNVAAFCPCLKSLPKAKVKRFMLVALTKDVLKKKKKNPSRNISGHSCPREEQGQKLEQRSRTAPSVMGIHSVRRYQTQCCCYGQEVLADRNQVCWFFGRSGYQLTNADVAWSQPSD